MGTSYFLYPSQELSAYIKYYWILKTDAEDGLSIQTIPSGCMHLVFHRGGDLYFSHQKKQPKNFIRGQFLTPGHLTSMGGIDMIAVVFHPLGMNPFFSYPMDEISNCYVDIRDLEDTALSSLGDLIKREENISECIRQIELFLLKRYQTNEYNYERVARSMQLIMTDPYTHVLSLAQETCLGYRHFKRLFTKYTGINPKEYIRIVRFQRALYALQYDKGMEITRLAYLSGYYDHSHLIKDFRALSGCCPTEYLLRRKPYSTLFSNDCRLNRIQGNS